MLLFIIEKRKEVKKINQRWGNRSRPLHRNLSYTGNVYPPNAVPSSARKGKRRIICKDFTNKKVIEEKLLKSEAPLSMLNENNVELNELDNRFYQADEKKKSF